MSEDEEDMDYRLRERDPWSDEENQEEEPFGFFTGVFTAAIVFFLVMVLLSTCSS